MSSQQQNTNLMQRELPENTQPTMKERLTAKMEGACAALEGRKLDANTYHEDSGLHFEWLAGWTSARLEMRKRQNKQ